MTWLYLALGILLGVCLGWLMHAHVACAIEAEDRQLREGLRYIRNLYPEPGSRWALVRYIDQLLGDEAA